MFLSASILAALIFSSFAWALPNLSAKAAVNCGLRKAEFVPSGEALRELAMPLAIMEAAPRIEVLDKSGKVTMTCSASMVSDQGHVLTAGHCLDPCVWEAGGFKKQDGVHVVDREKLEGVSCGIRVNGKRMNARVLAKNDCVPAEYFTGAKPCNGLDYALLKLDGDAPKSCFPLGRNAPASATPVMSIGFPAKTSRRTPGGSERDADGQSQMVSVGETLRFQRTCRTQVEDPGFWAGYFQGKERPTNLRLGPEFKVKALEQFVESGTMLQTSVDLWTGGSGGALVNRDGVLVGIGANSTKNSKFTECRGSGFFTSAAKLREHVSDNYPKAMQQGAFTCVSGAIR